MLVCCPVGRPDELFKSICAVYADRSRQAGGLQGVFLDLFGIANAKISLHLPTRIDSFVGNLPPGHSHTSDQIIRDHTFLPLYAPFLSPDQVCRLKDSMRVARQRMSRGYVGTSTALLRSNRNQWLRFCPLCVTEDRNKYGECYWHRVHQVNGILVCPIHKVWLEESNAPAHSDIYSQQLISAERATTEIATRQVDVSKAPERQLLQIAEDVAWLLAHGDSIPKDALRSRYHVALLTCALASMQGRVRIERLMTKFASFYTDDLLTMVGCELNKKANMSWVQDLLINPSRALHPIRHLLIIRCLGYSVAEFFELPTGFHPFGNGPWPCANKTCEHYLESVIRDCTWRRIFPAGCRGGRTVGTFTCPFCGFVYTRNDSVEFKSASFRPGTIKVYGPVWDDKLRELWTLPNISVDEMARQLGVSSVTVRRQAFRLDLPEFRPGNYNEHINLQFSSATNNRRPSSDKFKKYRASWLSLLKDHPDAGMGTLQSGHKKIVDWLRRNDPEWLAQHRPAPVRPNRRDAARKVNWDEIDSDLANKIKDAAVILINRPGRPARITATAVGRELGKLRLIVRYRTRLPQLVKVLAEVTETSEQFSVRRVWWAAEEYRRENRCPSKWQLIGRARGQVQDHANHPSVKAAIDAALAMLTKHTTS